MKRIVALSLALGCLLFLSSTLHANGGGKTFPLRAQPKGSVFKKLKVKGGHCCVPDWSSTGPVSHGYTSDQARHAHDANNSELHINWVKQFMQTKESGNSTQLKTFMNRTSGVP